MSTRTTTPVRISGPIHLAAQAHAAAAGVSLPQLIAEAVLARLRVEAPELASGLDATARRGRPPKTEEK